MTNPTTSGKDQFHGPLFLLGASRSGTTLLRLMFNAHPEVCVPSESRFLSLVLDTFPPEKILSKHELMQIRTILTTHESWPYWEIEGDELDGLLARDSIKTSCDIIVGLFETKCVNERKSICGEKTPHHCFYAATFARLFPSAKFVHLIRDGRGAAEAMWRRRFYERDIRRISSHWRGCVESVWKASSEFPGRFRDFHYEELVRNPEKILREMCEFLGIVYSDRLLAYRDDVQQNLNQRDLVQRGLHEKLTRPVDDSEADSWRSRLTAWQIFVFEAEAGPINQRAGYKPCFSGAFMPAIFLMRCGLRIVDCWRNLLSRLPASSGKRNNRNLKAKTG
jgi:hypothetical protein